MTAAQAAEADRDATVAKARADAEARIAAAGAERDAAIIQVRASHWRMTLANATYSRSSSNPPLRRRTASGLVSAASRS